MRADEPYTEFHRRINLDHGSPVDRPPLLGRCSPMIDCGSGCDPGFCCVCYGAPRRSPSCKRTCLPPWRLAPSGCSSGPVCPCFSSWCTCIWCSTSCSASWLASCPSCASYSFASCSFAVIDFSYASFHGFAFVSFRSFAFAACCSSVACLPSVFFVGSSPPAPRSTLAAARPRPRSGSSGRCSSSVSRSPGRASGLLASGDQVISMASKY